MSFWAYMLHCADRSFYVGHTDDLENRMAEHSQGEIKGWSRAKKLALIRGDWTLISALARNAAEKERASTGSARTG